ncbi:FAD-binding oxidoreductase, partial [Candidatus Bathyarchaeota archaeon]|nr:FAD-binding oxidoreductase [Candidatus Bathyarchaeota archaeon]
YDLIPYSRDRCPFLTHPKHGVTPLAVVRPATTEEVREIVVLANKHHVPLTPRGSGTNYAGSAVPTKGGVVVDLTRMNRILSVDEESMSAKVQPGLILQDFEEALNKRGFTFGHDPGSFPSATVGGCISTWSLGWRAGKYGDMGRLVLALKVVLPTGLVIETRSVPKSSTGFDVKSLFIGAEGAMGIITEAVLRIHPSPEKRAIQIYGFKDFERAFKASLMVLRSGLRPMMLLVMDEGEMEGLTKESWVKGGVMISYEGVKEVVETQVRRTASILEANEGIKLSDEAAEKYWANRHDVFSQMNVEGAAGSIDTAVPVSKVLEFYRFLKDWAKRRGVKIFGISSWVLPENLGMDSAFDESEAEAYSAARDEAVRKALELGGTVSYCVGVGLRFPHLMKEEHGPALDVMKAIKRALDPNNIMNPGWLSP